MMHPKRLSGTPRNIASYYTVGDYYSKDGSEPSSWDGKIAEELGLSGPVDADVFKRLLAGEVVRDHGAENQQTHDSVDYEPAPRDQEKADDIFHDRSAADHDDSLHEPADKQDFEAAAQSFAEQMDETNQQLGRRQPDGSIQHHPGWDFGLNAPKSVSLMALIGGDERLIGAHEKAVNDALSYLEEHAGTRIRVDGEIEHRKTGRLLMARFTEFASRELDPHLHTHVVVLNMTNFEDDEQMRSLETRTMYSVQKGAGQIYRNTLAHHVLEAGYEIDSNPRTGAFELRYVPENAIEQFSQRHEQIDAYAEEHGLHGQAERAMAWAATRKAKENSTHESMRNEWAERSPQVSELLQQIREFSQDRNLSTERERSTAIEALRFGLAQNESKEAVNNRDRIIRTGLAAHVGETTWAEMKPILEDREDSGKLQKTHSQTGGELLLRGRTTGRSIRQEEKIADELALAHQATQPLATEERAIAAAAARNLNEEQTRAVAAISTSENRIVGVLGVAGAGKSTMARAIIDAAEPDHRFISLGTTSTAAYGIGSKTDTDQLTLASLLHKNGRVNGQQIDSNTTILLDEASMVSTRQAIRLMEITRESGTRIIFLGDTKQLGAIEKGKPLWLLHSLGMETTLLKNSQRAATENMRMMSTLARQGKYRESFAYFDHIVTDEDYSQLAGKAVDDYMRLSPANRNKTAMLTLDNGTKTIVNNIVREKLKEEGKIHHQEISYNVLVPENMSGEEKRNSKFYKNGQVVVLAKDNDQAQLKADREYRVTGHVVGQDGKRLVRLEGPDGSEKLWQPRSQSASAIGVFKAERRELAAGDRIQWRLKSADGKIHNAERGTITAVSENTVRIRWDDRNRTMILDLSQTRNKMWDHGYAETVYQAQGKDYDRPFGIIDRTSPLTTGQTFYTFLTRGRFGARLYTQDQDKLAELLSKNSGEKSSALEGMDMLKHNSVPERLQRDDGQLRQRQQEDRAAAETRERVERERQQARRGEPSEKSGLRNAIIKLAREIERANGIRDENGKDGPIVRAANDSYKRLSKIFEKKNRPNNQQENDNNRSRGHER